MFLYLITGKTGNRLDYFANLLKNLGLKQIKWEKAKLSQKKGIEQKHNFLVGYRTTHNFYYLRYNDLYNKNFCIIKPDLIKTLAKKLPDDVFQVVYVQAELAKRQADYLRQYPKGKKRFKQINDQEKREFYLLDKIVKADQPDLTKLPANLDSIHSLIDQPKQVKNDLQIWAKTLADNLKIYERLANIVRKSSDLGLTKAMPDGRVEAIITDKKQSNTVTRYVSPTNFAAIILHDNAVLTQFLLQIIAKDDNLDQIYPYD